MTLGLKGSIIHCRFEKKGHHLWEAGLLNLSDSCKICLRALENRLKAEVFSWFYICTYEVISVHTTCWNSGQQVPLLPVSINDLWPCLCKIKQTQIQFISCLFTRVSPPATAASYTAEHSDKMWKLDFMVSSDLKVTARYVCHLPLCYCAYRWMLWQSSEFVLQSWQKKSTDKEFNNEFGRSIINLGKNNWISF